MTCFEWQTISGDYLDHSLPDKTKTRADAHLTKCGFCSERYKHYKIILASIANQPKHALPADIQKAPFSFILPRSDTSLFSLSRWNKIPWYLRTCLEAMGIIAVISIGIALAPKLRSLYETKIEQSMIEFKESLKPADPGLEHDDTNIPLMNAKPVAAASNGHDELSGEGEEDDDHPDVRVGRSQLWRFILKTVSPDEFRPMVIKVLTDLKVPPTTEGLGGTQVPGGIEFDLVLPQTMVPHLKKGLERLVPQAEVDETKASDTAKHTNKGNDNFSWYKVKSKRKLPENTSQIVIFLAQPNHD